MRKRKLHLRYMGTIFDTNQRHAQHIFQIRTKKFVFIILLSSLISSCNNRNSSSHNDTINDKYNISENDAYVPNSDEIVGYWTQYRADSDNYLLGHYLFNANGTGYWILTGSLANDKDVRGTFKFIWHQDESKNIVTVTENRETEILSFSDGAIVKQSVLGNEIYLRDDNASPNSRP